MYKGLVQKAEDTVKRLIDKLVVGMTLDVFAEGEEPAKTEPPADPAPVTAPSPSVDIAALIAQVRTEEKNKLYPQIAKLKEEVAKYKGLYETVTAEKVELGKEVKALKEKLDGVEDPELIQTLNAKIAELEGKLAEKPDETAIRAEIRAELEKEQEVKDYIKKVTDENSNVLLSVFADNIKGTTVEEVDTALADAIEKSKKTRKDLGLPEEGTATKKTNTKKHTTEQPPVANPQVTTTSPAVALSVLKNMDVRSDEYKEYRKKMGFK